MLASNEKVVELLLEKEGIDVNAQDMVRPPPHTQMEGEEGSGRQAPRCVERGFGMFSSAGVGNSFGLQIR